MLNTKFFILSSVIILNIIFTLNFVKSENIYPLIAILSTPEEGNEKTATKYIVNANYVRWLESNGMESIAIHPFYTESQIVSILQKVNGVLLQGENIPMELDSSYYKSVKTIVEKVKFFSQNPTFNTPILGICSGFNILLNSLAEENLTSTHMHLKSKSSLIFDENEIKDTRLFNKLNDQLVNIFKNTQSIYENHSLGVGPEKFTLSGAKIREFMNIVALDKDSEGGKYVASAEGVNGYPFFGVQFHPEIISFNKIKDNNVPDSFEAVLASKHFGHFLLKQVALNKNKFNDARDDSNYMTGKLSGPADKSGAYYFRFDKPSQ